MNAGRTTSRPGRAPGVRAAIAAGALALFAAAPLPAQTTDVRNAVARIDAEQIRAHITFLSSDLLEGRGLGTRGGALAGAYIAGQFAQAGLQPLHGRWQHPVPLRAWRADTARTGIVVGDTLRLGAGAGALLWTAPGRDSAVVRAGLVFAGYGTRAPEYEWNDYASDVRGRIVLVLVGDPPAPPGTLDFFEGDALTYYGRWTYKIEEAARQGAAAVLLVHAPELAGYGWDVVRTGWGGSIVSLREDSSAVLPAIAGWLRRDAAQRLLAAAGLDFDELFVRAARRDFEPVPAAIELQLEARGTGRSFQSPNVAALLPGSDPELRAEVVVFTAHHDGLGIGAAVDGDSIYNGAYDNAAGTALLIEVAESFAALRTRPARSILFLATTAEEAGLLGSTHYLRHPLVPVERTIAAINFEGANFWGETDDVAGVGLERSTLGPALQRAAALLRMRATPERSPGQGFFFRSDHFSFARAGIPAIALDHGLSYRNRPAGWGASTLSAFLASSYHAPFDQLPADADLDGAVQQARIAFLLGLDLAQVDERPRYYDGLSPLPPPPARPEPSATNR